MADKKTQVAKEAATDSKLIPPELSVIMKEKAQTQE